MKPAYRRASDRIRRSGVRGPSVALFLVLLTVLLMPLSQGGALTIAFANADGAAHAAGSTAAAGATSPSERAAASVTSARAPAPAAAPTPSAAPFNPNCFPVDTGMCVSIMNPGEANIVPNGTNRVSPVMPNCNTSLPLVLKSHTPLNASSGSSPRSGEHSPIALNVTGTLWNGDPYFSKYDDSIWHSDNNIWWQLIGDAPQNDKTYPWWYELNISATAANGAPNFFPGELVTWWIYLVFSEPGGAYLGYQGPQLQYTCAGAWPYSPYPGAPHYGGPDSIDYDSNITLTPRAPNWNDSVDVTVNTTQADVAPYNATIGAATIDLVEVAHGLVLYNTSWSFNVTVNEGFGNTTTATSIPAVYAQIEGATVSYRIWISDTSKTPDWLVSPWTNYTVNGNGSFPTGSFTSDLSLGTSPNAVVLDGYGQANLTPGQPLKVVVTSRNPTDAILAVEILYTVAYPLLHETIHESVELSRASSTEFKGSIPALPLDTVVNFTVYAWDFTQAVEVSNPYSYTVETFDQYVGPIFGGLTFFYVLVYDNGTQSWVQGANVQILGPNNVLNSVSNTTLGIAYANQTGAPFIPLLVKANTTYSITVTDSHFVPGGGNAAPYGPVTASVQAVNPMTATQPLASNPHYLVLQQGNEILFLLNASAPPAPSSPSIATGNPLGTLGIAAVVGLIGASVASIPISLWWRQIKSRRTAEEKRVTL